MDLKGLKHGQTINNRELMNIFHCACEGGIRYSKKTETVVIVVNNTKSGLPNKWKNGILEFAGRIIKKTGELCGANRRLEQFLNSGEDVYLFEVNSPGQYEYKGQVVSAGSPLAAKTADGREYPVFPLKLKQDQTQVEVKKCT